jgi:lactoylglutathione lyase
MFEKLRPNLMVHDVNETVDYYKKVFGAELEMSVPEQGTWDWAMVKMDNVQIMFEVRRTMSEGYKGFEGKEIGGTLSFYIDVKDVDALHAKVKAAGAKVVDIYETFYGAREFYVEDLNGYMLTFSSRK